MQLIPKQKSMFHRSLCKDGTKFDPRAAIWKKNNNNKQTN